MYEIANEKMAITYKERLKPPLRQLRHSIPRLSLFFLVSLDKDKNLLSLA